MDETSKKNFKIINQVLKEIQAENQEMKEEIVRLKGTIAMMDQRVNQLQQSLYAKLGNFAGNGPTT